MPRPWPLNGGKDRWNVGPTGYVEADGCLDIVLRIGKFLEYNNIKVVYTRTGDYSLKPWTEKGFDLTARAKVANSAGADLFVSVHTNAGSPEAHGTETFCYKMGQNGERIARLIQKYLVYEMGRYDRGVKVANFAVLRLTNMPAALTEIAFHTNLEEEKILKDETWRNRSAWAIAVAIGEYFGVKVKYPQDNSQALDELRKKGQELRGQINSLTGELETVNNKLKQLGGEPV